MLQPIATGPQVLGAINATRALIKDALQEGTDYGRIPNTPKNTLLKPGAEKSAAAFGTVATYDSVESEIDHDRAVVWYKGNDKKQSVGLYRYVTRCTLTLRDGTVVGTGLATCSTMESKYVSRPRDCENTALKMSNKRALVAAVLGTFGLSEAFTQDVGDDEDDEDVRMSERATPPPQKPAGPTQAELVANISREFDRLGVAVKDRKAETAKILGGHAPTSLADLADLLSVLVELQPPAPPASSGQAALIPDDTDKRGGAL
jgi:hypothetical protein